MPLPSLNTVCNSCDVYAEVIQIPQIRAIMGAVLGRAFCDLDYIANPERHVMWEAIRWFRSEDDESIFSYRFIVDFLGLSESRIQETERRIEEACQYLAMTSRRSKEYRASHNMRVQFAKKANHSIRHTQGRHI